MVKEPQGRDREREGASMFLEPRQLLYGDFDLPSG